MGLVGADALPADGLLLFFYDQDQPWGYSPEDSDRFRVMLVDDFGLRGVAPPGNVARLPSCKLSLAQKTTIPDILSMEVEELVLSNVESDDYVEMSEAYAKRFPGPEHQMLGHPVLVQGDMRLEVALVAAGYDCGDGSAFQSEAAQELVHEVTAWKLLLQLDSDDDAGMMWGDAGLLYFWIHEDDLAQRDFTRVRVVLQCT